MGAVRQANGWPLACFPLFDGLTQDSYTTLLVRVTNGSGQERELNPHDYRSVFGNRWNNLLSRILDGSDEAEKRERLGLVWSVMAQHDDSLADVDKIRFVSFRTRLAPAFWYDPPFDPKTLHEMTF